MNFLENVAKYKVWILAPFIEFEDDNLSYYYDYSQSIAEYTKVFSEINCEWVWKNVTLQNYEKTLFDIKSQTEKINIIMNLCDGDEVNGTPGVSVIKALDKLGMIYTGSDSFFYDITTSKIPMKKAFDTHFVSTPKWKVVENDSSPKSVFNEVGDLLIVKPAVSGGSMGLSLKNVVDTETDFNAAMENINEGYRGWKLNIDGVFVEDFIKGREFTTFLVGTHNDPENIIYYPPAERIFHESLPEKEQFLSFDRLWETYDEESPMPENGNLYEYAVPETSLNAVLKDISIRAYQAVGGTGYGRIDIRMDSQTGELYILEVNAQSGISESENETSIGAILRFAGKSFTDLVVEILQDALNRHS